MRPSIVVTMDPIFFRLHVGLAIINLKCRDILAHKNTFNMYQSSQIFELKKPTTTTLIERSFFVCVHAFFPFHFNFNFGAFGFLERKKQTENRRNSSLMFVRVILCKIIDEKRVQVYWKWTKKEKIGERGKDRDPNSIAIDFYWIIV